MMNDKKFGVIDLGTNTFHLLIASWNVEKRQVTEIIRKRFFVKLSTRNANYIEAEPYQRGIEAMIAFADLLSTLEVNNIKAYGTSAMRNATNAHDFQKEVHKKTGIHIQIISGKTEAELIYKGVLLSFPFTERPELIMDIGGGSVEFIIANKSSVHYAESFKIGIARLKNKFHLEEPIQNCQTIALNNFLERELKALGENLVLSKPISLIGASGTFDVLENILPHKKITDTSSILDTVKLEDLCERIISMPLEGRIKDNRIPNSRADLIVVALLLIKFVWNRYHFSKFIVTKNSMKEGMLFEMIQDQKPRTT